MADFFEYLESADVELNISTNNKTCVAAATSVTTLIEFAKLYDFDIKPYQQEIMRLIEQQQMMIHDSMMIPAEYFESANMIKMHQI